MRTRLGALLGICPECLYRKRARCFSCRHTGRWARWLESEKLGVSELSDRLAYQLYKVTSAYWRDVGRRWDGS